MARFIKSSLLFIFALTLSGYIRQPPTYDRALSWPPAVNEALLPKCGPLMGCEADALAERQSEIAYWTLIARGDLQGMRQWLSRADSYAKHSDSPRSARFFKLSSFGHLMLSRALPLLHPRGVKAVLTGLRRAKQSEDLNNSDPSIHASTRFSQAMLELAKGNPEAAEPLIEDLLNPHESLGPFRQETINVGALALMSVQDPAQIRQGLNLLEADDMALPRRTTSLAPYKMMGTYLAMIEAYAFLGEADRVLRLQEHALQWAIEHGSPDKHRAYFVEVVDNMLKPEGLIDEWRDGKSLGELRYPLGPSAGLEGCILCHAGARLPEGVYAR